MMVMRTGIAVAVSGFFAAAVLADEADCGNWSFHANELKNGLDTTRWKNFYTDDTWCIRCIFVDMDNDGKEELITATTSDEEDRTGWVWRIYRKGKGRGFNQMMRRRNPTDIFFLCHWYSFYKVSYSGWKSAVVGLDMNANLEEPCDNGVRRIVRATPDCKFIVMPENKFTLREIHPDVDTSFRRRDVVSIERLYPEWYFGFEFRPPKEIPHSPITLRPPSWKRIEEKSR